jgi:signal transduction histidine kinase/DNA-binding LacI/PurR family transcriptional regulator/AraC-like DNA-binding protein
MQRHQSRMLTIGVLASWQVYEGTTIGRYLHTLLRGVHAAALEKGCNLLLACGIGSLSNPQSYTSAWPVPATDADFVPVGPWNTDGLIVVPQSLSSTQSHYLQNLIASGHPVVFAGPEEPGPAVVVDNAEGIRQAFAHLLGHGHRHIAFIAGYEPHSRATDRPGDSDIRLQGYHGALRDSGLEHDPRLVAYGEHNTDGGRRAMRRILATGARFTAVLASNDQSCFGAVEALKEAGLRIPHDVAVIGFDDILDAKAHAPPLTTVRHSTFTMGYQALQLLCDRIEGRSSGDPVIQIPTRLVIRQSCGCRPGIDLGLWISTIDASVHGLDAFLEVLTRVMAEATLIEARYCTRDELQTMCHGILTAFLESVQRADTAPFEDAIVEMLRHVEALDEDAHAWHAAILALRDRLPVLLSKLDLPANHVPAYRLLDQARLEISERTRRQTTRALLSQMDVADELGLMTAQLLAALDEAQLPAILSAHLPRVGVRHMLVALFSPYDDDLVAHSTVLLRYGMDERAPIPRFASRRFPPQGLYPSDAPFHLALLPLRVEDKLNGFVAFDAANLEPCAAIVRNLAAALRSSQLYRHAYEGQRLAEEANRLKSRFLSMVSHELRTPLNLIVGLSELLLREDQQQPALPAERRQDLERIATSAQHLGRLIGDVLDLTSSEAGQLRLAHEPLDLSETLRMVAVTGERMARDKGLAWRADLPQPGPQILGDRTRLRQIVLNLISNAVKFTSAGSVTLDVLEIDEQAVIRVSDTGPGVLADEQPHIFDEFWRSERTATREQSGLGLGLAICKHLVDLHGGTISVRSDGQSGAGTTFVISLPTLKHAREPLATLAGQLAPYQQVLILADQEASGAALADYLTRHGYTVQLQAGDANVDNLIGRLASQRGALLLESRIASRRGWEIMRALHSLRDRDPIPVLLFSLDTQDDVGALLELNYRIKPLDSVQFAQALWQHGLLDEVGNAAAKTVLIVDDNAEIRAMHARMVQEQAAYRVLQAANGREALAIMRETRPDLVLLDLVMPELDGFGVLEAMRADERLSGVPVVVLTAQTLTEDELARLNHGVSAVLSKGLFSVDETLRHITAAIDRHHRLGSPTQRLIHKAIAYIQGHYAEPLSREQIAAYIGMHENYLTDCFHREMGITPITYLTRYRLKQARALLEAGQQSITEIALAVGFTDSAYFSRVFQREVGVSPSAYQRGRRAIERPNEPPVKNPKRS